MNEDSKRRLGNEIKTLGEWARQYGMTWPQLRQRLNEGYTLKEAVAVPIARREKTTDADGRKVNLRKMAREAGIKYTTVWRRVHHWGWDLEAALRTPAAKGNRIGKGEAGE